MRKIIIALIIGVITTQMIAQNYKFGKVSKEELEEQFYSQDSSANAVVLFKKRRTYFEYEQKEGFGVVTEIHERIKIYNKEDFSWATKKIKYYSPKGSTSEDVNIQDAKTYVLENGKRQSYKLNKKDTYNVKLNKYWSEEKFSMPNISEGCIVEWRYKITSPYRGINKVIMQYEIPVEKFQCKIEIPEYYNYNVKHTGYLQVNSTVSTKYDKIVLNTKSRSGGSFFTPSKTSFSSQNIDYMSKVIIIDNENIPALMEEPYMNNINNYRSGIEFELSSTKWPNEPIKYYSKSWEDVTKTIYKENEFGRELNKSSYYKDDLEKIIVECGDNKTKIILALFEFVKQKVKWNGYKGVFTDKGVKEAFKTGVGNSADINLILIAMLREAKINANPVILSTRDHGIPIFPTINGFNFVIAAVEIDNKVLLLDATEENSTPNVLPLRNLNWEGRIVREEGTSLLVDLIPSDMSYTNSTMNISIDGEGTIEGKRRVQYTNLNALKYRNKYSKIKDEDIFNNIEEKNGNIEIFDFEIRNKNEIYNPVVETYKFISEDLISVIGDKIYFKPLFFDAITENPFKLEKRKFPIDFGAPAGVKNRININIPEGYAVEFLPKSIAVALPNNYGLYKFNISAAGNKINIFSTFQMNTALYPVAAYSEIKEFYKMIINKNLEQVVLRKVS